MHVSTASLSSAVADDRLRLRSLGLAAKTLAMLRAYKIPCDPPYYRIFYAYFLAADADLVAEVDQTIARTGGLTTADLEGLHARHFPGVDDGAVDKIGAGIRMEIETLSRLVATSLENTQSFADSIDGTVGGLVEAKANGIEAMVAFLQKATGRMQQANQAVHQRLEERIAQINTLRKSLDAARAESCNDGLTELYNRKHFDKQFLAAVSEAAEKGKPLSLVMIDIDLFKSFNDRYGHKTGDQVLRLVANSIRNLTKGQDISARFGGEEFVVALPNTSAENATKVAESMRRDIAARKLKKKSTGEVLGQITVSAGIAALQPRETPESLIERADACLYEAKRAGRNRVVADVSNARLLAEGAA